MALFRRKVNVYYSMEAQSGANGQQLGESIVNVIGSRDIMQIIQRLYVVSLDALCRPHSAQGI